MLPIKLKLIIISDLFVEHDVFNTENSYLQLTIYNPFLGFRIWVAANQKNRRIENINHAKKIR